MFAVLDVELLRKAREGCFSSQTKKMKTKNQIVRSRNAYNIKYSKKCPVECLQGSLVLYLTLLYFT